ncbi:MAG TPA: hypothetical protein VE871_18010 [Longimicrobium sp.]|nr:hypothetical protein [Longimicrobium sp.]
MPYAIPRIRSARRATSAGLLLLAAACGGDVPEELSQTANAEGVDQASSASITEREQADFSPPADGVLTTRQVDALLRTTLVQFDLIRQEAPRYHQKLAQMEERGAQGGLIAGLRSAVDAGGVVLGFGDMVSGSFVRSARSQGVNPAEMEWVRGQMVEVSAHFAMRAVHQERVDQARAMRAQAEQYRGQPGFSDEQVREMIRNAEQSERDAREQMKATGTVARNLEVLRRAKPNVTPHMWGAVTLAGGAGGLAGLSGLATPNDTTAQRQMDEWRRIYTDALANQVTPGLEATAPAGSRPRLDGAS